MEGWEQSRGPGTLVVPAVADVEREHVVAAWAAAGGDVMRLARFCEPPRIHTGRVRLYGNDTFCLVLAELLDVALVSPPDDFLLHLDRRRLGRDVTAVAMADATSLSFPRFVKPLVPKQFPARVYESSTALAAYTHGLDPTTLVLHSPPVQFKAEARVFVLAGEAAATSIYRPQQFRFAG